MRPSPLGRVRSWLLARLGPGWLFGTLAACVVALVIVYELEPGSASHVAQPFAFTRRERDLVCGALALVSTCGLFAYGVLRRFRGFHRRGVQTTISATLVALTCVAGLAYFYGARGAQRSYAHAHDSYHYLLGAKYYAELDYFRLYECTVEALDRRVIPDDTKARDLYDDRMTTAGELRKKATCNKSFSPARWEMWKKDLGVYFAADRGLMRGAIKDRGYNGAPFHTLVAGALANSFTLDYRALSMVTLIDVLALCAMLSLASAAFGLRLGLVCALFFFTQFADRHVIIGASYLRYLWMVSLGLGLVALKRRRYGWAGSAIAISAALNVFPVLFAGGIAVKALRELLRGRRPALEHRHFLASGIVVGVLCLGLGALHTRGVDNYRSFLDNMRTHDVAGRLQGYGVGLKYDFAYRGEHHKESYSHVKKSQEFAEAKPLFVAIAALLVLFALAVALRLDDVEATVLVGFTTMFCVFGPSAYYYACAALLVLLWHRRAWDSGGLLQLSLLFALSLAPYYGYADGLFEYFLYNTLISVPWTLYLVGVLGYLGAATGLFADLACWLAAAAPAPQPRHALEIAPEPSAAPAFTTSATPVAASTEPDVATA